MSDYDCDKVEIVYFSGTGGSAKIADMLASRFSERGIAVSEYELHKRTPPNQQLRGLLILVYPVHVFNAPEPVYAYIDALQMAENAPSAVLSVSGGGEITPNTASRLRCIRRLEKRGYRVIYEKMLVMPSNCFVPTPDGLIARLFDTLPAKINSIVDELLSGLIRRTSPSALNRFFTFAGELKKTRIGTRAFGKHIRSSDACSGCGLCERSCPQRNISIENGRPVFHKNCVACLRCIYICPERALAPGLGKFIVLKKGYDLNAMQNINYPIDPPNNSGRKAGYAYSGVKKFLDGD